MSRKNPVRAAKRTNSRLQAFLLLILGVFCVLAAWLLHPNPYAYPVGILVLGLGMLLAAALNPHRLVIGGILTALIGMAVFLSLSYGMKEEGHRSFKRAELPGLIAALNVGRQQSPL